MNYLDYNCQDRNILNNGHLFNFVAANTWLGAGNVPEPFGVAFHHVGPTLINAYISKIQIRSLSSTLGGVRTHYL